MAITGSETIRMHAGPQALRDYHPRRAIVTGAGRGIGFATAQRLTASGTQVAILSHHEDTARRAAREVGTEAIPIWGDLGEEAEARDAMDHALEALGGCDLLVNNAGWTLTSSFLSEEPAYWDRVLRVNLSSVLWCTHRVLPALVQVGGSIVNVASDAGRVGMQGEAAYSAAKGGVIAFTKAVAQEFARDGVRANVVCPGPTRTRVLEENMADPKEAERIERMIRRIPLRRVAEPEEIASAIVFLASAEGAYMTGQVLSVSGGLTML